MQSADALLYDALPVVTISRVQRKTKFKTMTLVLCMRTAKWQNNVSLLTNLVSHARGRFEKIHYCYIDQ